MKAIPVGFGLILLFGGAAIGGWNLYSPCTDSPSGLSVAFGVPSCSQVLVLVVVGGGAAVAGLLMTLWGLVASDGLPPNAVALGPTPRVGEGAGARVRDGILYARKVPKVLEELR